MRKAAGLALVLSLVALACAALEPGQSNPQDEGALARFLGHVNHGCMGRGDSARQADSGCFLTAATLHEDTLALSIHFGANCCPAFVESTEVSRQAIFITLADTLYGCRCMCEYDNGFLFLWPRRGHLAIHFRTSVPPSHGGACGFDTLISLDDSRR